jgi:hypothetical protein
MAATSSGRNTAPEGLDGELKTSILVFLVRARSSSSTLMRKPFASLVTTGTGVAPVR